MAHRQPEKSFFFLRFCRTWTKRYRITSQPSTRVKRVTQIHHRTILVAEDEWSGGVSSQSVCLKSSMWLNILPSNWWWGFEVKNWMARWLKKACGPIHWSLFTAMQGHGGWFEMPMHCFFGIQTSTMYKLPPSSPSGQSRRRTKLFVTKKRFPATMPLFSWIW